MSAYDSRQTFRVLKPLKSAKSAVTASFTIPVRRPVGRWGLRGRERSGDWHSAGVAARAIADQAKVSQERDGAPGEIRTPDPQIRSLVLYPAELRAPVWPSWQRSIATGRRTKLVKSAKPGKLRRREAARGQRKSGLSRAGPLVRIAPNLTNSLQVGISNTEFRGSGGVLAGGREPRHFHVTGA